MKREFDVENAKMVLTKNEYGFQEVLDDFENAKSIAIVTYNISTKHDHLLRSLREAGNSAKIKIVTNIPSRWDTYYGEKYKELAKKNIELYLAKLDPASFGSNYSLFFDFSNHGKIVATENIAYIGSSNFSDESKHNMEIGIIIRDAVFINYLMSDLIPEIEENATPYYEYNYMPLLLQTKMVFTTLFALENELIDQAYNLHDEHGAECRYFNDSEERYSQKTLEELVMCVADAVELLDECLDATSTLLDPDDDASKEQSTLVDLLHEIEECIDEHANSEELAALVLYDTTTVALSILEDEYGAVAIDEDLDKYALMSQRRAMDEFNVLCQEAKDDIDILIDAIRTFRENGQKFIKVFEKQNLQKRNDAIDNT